MNYLIRYGRSGFVGHYAGDGVYERGARVVIRSPRGIEVGTVLQGSALRADVEGTVTRPLTAGDDETHGPRVAAAILAFAEDAWGGLPVSLLDAEADFGATRVILHALAWGELDLTNALDELATRFGVQVHVQLANGASEPKGCGTSGCGTGSGGCSSCGTGGGCSTGNCSRGAAKTPEELTSYFGGLRAQIDARRTPLH